MKWPIAGLIILSLAYFPACSGRLQERGADFGGQITREKHWAGELRLDGQAIPLNVILVGPADFDGRSRVVILSAFGASMGDCRLTLAGPPVCRHVRGAAPVVDKIAEGLTKIMTTDADLLWGQGRSPAVGGKRLGRLQKPRRLPGV